MSWFARLFGIRLRPPTAPSPVGSDVAREAAGVCETEPPSTFVLLAKASYLPHGGTDRVTLRLRADGGRIERIRARGRRPPQHLDRELSEDESRSIREELDVRRIWQLDDRLDYVIDGLSCEFGLAEDGRTHRIRLREARSSPQYDLLRFLTGLAPIAEE